MKPVKKVIWRKKALKQFLKFPKIDRESILKKIDLLAAGAPNLQIKKLKGHSSYRLRVGVYRVVYQIENGHPCIIILLVGHRKQIYKSL